MNPIDPTSDASDLELASAALDGDITDAERARLAASPELRAMVASLEDVRSRVGDVPPADAGRRELALSAALAAFDDGDTAPERDTAPAIVHQLAARRRRQLGWFSGAAAAAVLVVVAIGVRGGSDDRPDTASKSAVATTASADTLDTTRAAAAPSGAAPNSEQAPSVAGATESAAGGAADSSAGTAPGTTTVQALAGPELSTPADLLSLPTTFTSVVPGPERTVAGSAADTSPTDAQATTAIAADTATGSTCVTPGLVDLGPVIYQGRPAEAVEDPATHIRRALALDDCTVLAEVAVP